MPTPRPWTIAKHQPLNRLADGLWEIEAELELLPIGRRMLIMQLANGDLVTNNVIACDDTTMAAIDAIGPIRWIVVPNGYHRLDAQPYATRYPNAKVVAPAGSLKRVAERCRVDGALDLLPADPSLRWEALDGVPSEAVLIHRDRAGGETLVFTDALMNLPAKLPGFKGALVKLMGSTGGPKVTRTAKLALVKDRASYAAQLRRLAALPGLTRVAVAHGANLTSDASDALSRVADQLHRAT